jgi:hypothetical protein
MIKIEATNAMVIVNWNTTRLFLMTLPLLPCENFPFSEEIVLLEDRMTAGYTPEIVEIKMLKPSIIKIFVPVNVK